MSALLTPIARCQEIAGLAAHEILLGPAPGQKHERLLARYCDERRSITLARAQIVADLRAAVAQGAPCDAADLLIVLRRLLAADAPRRRPPGARRPSSRTRRRGRPCRACATISFSFVNKAGATREV